MNHIRSEKLTLLNDTEDAVSRSCLNYMARHYNQKEGTELRTMRGNLFVRKTGSKTYVPPKLYSLPPTNAALLAHCRRVLQVSMWEAASSCLTPPCDISKYDWQRIYADLIPVYVNPQHHQKVLSIISCGCRKGCSCAKNAMSFTGFCFCQGQAQHNSFNRYTVDNNDEQQHCN